ncbi:MAG TPA: methyltransferase domain-containing protein [Terriglobales bacterium]
MNAQTVEIPAEQIQLQCLRCSTPTRLEEGRMRCPACGASWPIEKGIPRFFQPDYYWGEVNQEQASDLLTEATTLGWRNAVQGRFRNQPEMVASLLDCQRASWLPLLALASNSVALDIGSGYGAITHALAAAVGHVCSVEAVPERVEFSRIRFEQEGVCNVQLIQASALEMPFPDRSFDLIVVNGVLEWVGEFARVGDPRRVQLDFLKSVCRLLKDDGRLVIGIENRLSRGSFRGGLDHSGVAYTNLMPRWLASWYLRRKVEPHHRMSLNAERQYRTYTYTERGYRKLLAESGFRASDFYWADPGYNQPHAMVPLTGHFVRRHCGRKQDGLQYRRHGWRRLAAAVAELAMPLVAPEFVIFAAKVPSGDGHGPASRISELVPELAGAKPSCSLYTAPFSHRSAVWAFDSGANQPRMIVKVSDGSAAGSKAVAAEFSGLSLVASRLAAAGDVGFAVPQPGRCWKNGRLTLATEAAVRGSTIAARFAGCPFRAFSRLGEQLSQCIGISTRIAKLLRGEAAVELVGDDDRRIPGGFEGSDGDLRLLTEVNQRRRCRDLSWVQHGDYTIENILFDSSSQSIGIVDWEHMVRGVMPLYDVFSLLISALYLAARWGEPAAETLQRPFEEAFFGKGTWAEMYLALLMSASQQLETDPLEVWGEFVEFLILRTNLYGRKSREMEREHSLFLATAVSRRQDFVMFRK